MRYTLCIVGNTRSRTAPGRAMQPMSVDYSVPPRPANRTSLTEAEQAARPGGPPNREGGGNNGGLINKPITRAFQVLKL